MSAGRHRHRGATQRAGSALRGLLAIALVGGLTVVITTGVAVPMAQAATTLDCSNSVYELQTRTCLAPFVARLYSVNLTSGASAPVGPSLSIGGTFGSVFPAALAISSDGSAAYFLADDPTTPANVDLYKYTVATNAFTVLTTVPAAESGGAYDPVERHLLLRRPRCHRPPCTATTPSPAPTSAKLAQFAGPVTTDPESTRLRIRRGRQSLHPERRQLLPEPGAVGRRYGNHFANRGHPGQHSLNLIGAGLAFGADGYLYGNGTAIDPESPTLTKIEPGSAVPIATLTPTPAIPGQVTNLASCIQPNTLSVVKDLPSGRAGAADQFNLSLTGGSLSVGNTATTTGTATGVQPDEAGPVLARTGTSYTALRPQQGRRTSRTIPRPRAASTRRTAMHR